VDLLDLQLLSSSMQLTIFLFPLSHTGMLGSVACIVVATIGALRDATSCCFSNHSTVKPTYSLGQGIVAIPP